MVKKKKKSNDECKRKSKGEKEREGQGVVIDRSRGPEKWEEDETKRQYTSMQRTMEACNSTIPVRDHLSFARESQIESDVKKGWK